MRRLKISVLFLAFMALMGHSIIPHHHHYDDSLESHNLCCENHNNNDATAQRSDAGQEESSDCCKLKELLVTPPDIQKYNGLGKEERQKSFDDNFSAVAIGAPSVNTWLTPDSFYLPPIIATPVRLLTGPDSCRAPPVA